MYRIFYILYRGALLIQKLVPSTPYLLQLFSNGEKCFQCVAFVNIGMIYSGHYPSVDDASVVGDAFVYDTSVDNASVDDEHYSDMSPTKYLNLYHIIIYKSH